MRAWCLGWGLLLATTPVLAAAGGEPAPAPDAYFDAHTIRGADAPADAPTFADYPAGDPLRGAFARPRVHASARARLFRTVLRQGAREGVNFAGHYRIVIWGCGAGCAALAIVDGITGRVFFPRDLLLTENENVAYEEFGPPDPWPLAFRPDSRLVVVVGGINEDPARRGISYFVWQHERLRRIRFVPRPP